MSLITGFGCGSNKTVASHNAEADIYLPTGPIASKSETAPKKSAEVALSDNAARRPIASSNRSIKAVKALQSFMLNNAESVIDKFGLKKSSLLSTTGLIKETESLERAATEKEMKLAGGVNTRLINHVAQLYSNRFHISLKASEKKIRQEFKDAGVNQLNNRLWQPINTTVDIRQHTFSCNLVPAGQMKLGAQDIFPQSYHDKGVCCGSANNIQHAANLWSSEFSVPDKQGNAKTLFKGIRHGINSPYNLPVGDAARKAGALARAKEVVTAALFIKPALLEKALKGDSVNLQLVSTSLVTPSHIGNEEEMLKDQIEAWQTLSQQTPLILPVRNAQGECQQVKINLQTAAFNFGVNELALKFGLGQKVSEQINAAAFKVLIGDDFKPDAPPAGMAGEYLQSNPENRQQVLALCEEIKYIINNKLHLHDGGAPYKLAQRVARLAWEIGAVPCYNCKSGKDRTGMLDTEIKSEAVKQHLNCFINDKRSESTEDTSAVFNQLLLKSGNAEIQQYNTAAPGNKVIKRVAPGINLSYQQRIGDRKVWEEVQGLSGLIKS